MGGSAGRYSHLPPPENAVECLTVSVKTRDAPIISINILGSHKPFIIDTGSNIFLVQPGIHPSKFRDTGMPPLGVTGDTLAMEGEQNVEIHLRNRNFRHKFYVCSLPTEADGILGTNILLKKDGCLDLDRQELRLNQCPLSQGPARLVKRLIKRLHVILCPTQL
jgi:hypothetical protein